MLGSGAAMTAVGVPDPAGRPPVIAAAHDGRAEE